MMRKAIITELKEITDFSNRVYQSYAAPSVVEKPYCVVKLTGENPVVNNKLASMLELQVFIYNTPGSFLSLDDLEMKVRKQLHGKTLSTDESPARFFTVYYDRTLADWFDSEANLFMKTSYFYIPLARH
jgi:hypothetical protein